MSVGQVILLPWVSELEKHAQLLSLYQHDYYAFQPGVLVCCFLDSRWLTRVEKWNEGFVAIQE